MKRKGKLAIAFAALAGSLFGCASPVSSSESLPKPSSEEASATEPIPESSQQASSENDYYEFYHSDSLFEKDFSHEDGIYQVFLNSILDYKEQGLSDASVESRTIRMFCYGTPPMKLFSLDDFPEVPFVSIDQIDNEYGSILLGKLPDGLYSDSMRACFCLIDNPYVTYACPRRDDLPDPMGFPFLRFTTEIWSHYYDRTKPPSDEILSIGDATDDLTIEEKKEASLRIFDENFTLKTYIPGYFFLNLRLRLSGNGIVYGVDDFPEIEATHAIEYYPTSSVRRALVVRIKDNSVESTRDAISKLCENPLIDRFMVYNVCVDGYCSTTVYD